MRHLQPRPLKPTLDIKPLIRLTTIQNRLVAARLLGNEIQRLDNLQPKLFPLLVFRDSDVFDVAYYA